MDKGRIRMIVMGTMLILLAIYVVGNSSTPPEPVPASAPAAATANKQSDDKPSAPNSVAVFATSQGQFKVELYEDKAPQTAKNFIALAEKGFFNNLIFHRVIDKFMIQGGDPSGNGTGGPGYTIPDEFHPSLKHDAAGILSMANRGPNTGGSQFFITLAPTPWLDGKHAVFGKVVEGMDVVQAIGKTKTGAGDRPITPVVINKVTIEKR